MTRTEILLYPHYTKIKMLKFSKYFSMATEKKTEEIQNDVLEERILSSFFYEKRKFYVFLKESLLAVPFCLVVRLGKLPNN